MPMMRSHRARRCAVVGLAATTLVLIGSSVLGTVSTRRSAETVARSAALAEAYDRAHDAVTAEESLERKYRLEPSDAVRRAMAAVSEVAMLAVPSRNPSMPRGSAPSPGRKPVCRQRSLA